MPAPEVKALIFDVFGTVVDWRGSIIGQCAAFGQARGIERGLGRLCRCLAGQVPPLYGQGAQRRTALD